MLKTLWKNTRNCGTSKIQTIHILVILFLCFYASVQSAKANEQDTAKNKTNAIKMDWNNVASVFANAFGTVDINIKSDDVIDFKDFEIFLSQLSGRTNSSFLKTNVSIEQLALVPKPLILKNQNTEGPIVLLDIFQPDQVPVYQLLYSSSRPVLFSRNDLENIWSGEVWYIENPSNIGIMHKSDELSLQISKISQKQLSF